MNKLQNGIAVLALIVLALAWITTNTDPQPTTSVELKP